MSLRKNNTCKILTATRKEARRNARFFDLMPS
jgi:hypothetical protein